MIVYRATAGEFKSSVDEGNLISQIEAAFKTKLGRGLPPSEVSAYRNSLPQMERVVRRSGIADDCGVLIEYKIPLTGYRIDFVITGEDEHRNKNFVIVELKQWSSAEIADGDGLVETYTGHSLKVVTHPSYQAYSYKNFIEDFNQTVADGTIKAYSCAYLHNYLTNSPEPLADIRYAEIIEQSPIFFNVDQAKLEQYLARYVKHGKGTDILYEIENGKIKPSKKLLDHVSSLFDGNQAYVLLDEQKVAFERARVIARGATQKSVVIIKGGPGTGKSVISVNLLGALLRDDLNVTFVAPNSSFRDTLMKRLARDQSPLRIRNIFKGSSGYFDSKSNDFDVLIVDEAHRLKRKGAFMYRGMNQVDDVINAARTSIFFIDDDQAVRPEDIGTINEIQRIAKQYSAQLYEMELVAQFRCAGAEGYINWLNDVLHIKQTANYDGWERNDFEFTVFDDPNALRQAIKRRAEEGNTARILAGYAWEWTTENKGNRNAEVEDVTIPEFDFRMPWNSRKVGTTWAIDESGIDQVGCIHTSQGLEFDYVGVIVGNDLTFDPDSLSYNSDHEKYKDSVGKKGLKNNPKELNRLVRNIYKILMTRGMKGCYVYFSDINVEKYFRQRLSAKE